MRHLVRFFLLGALLCFAKRSLDLAGPQAELPTLRVVVKQSASDAELERAIDEAVLVEQAVSRAGALLDPVVREQLLLGMRGRTQRGEQQREDNEHERGPEDDAALLKRAVALGLHRADPVARQRLMFQAEQLLMARAASVQVADAELTQYLRDHAQRYAEPPRFTFTHVFLSRARRADALPRDAAELLATLAREQASAGAVLRAPASTPLGDATLLPRWFEAASAATIDARFGAGFADALGGLEQGVWSGPIPSAYGLHLVQLGAHLPGRLPALAAVYPRVLADYRHDQRERVLRACLRTLRSAYRLDVRRLRA